MSEIELFTFNDHQVRTVLLDGEPWFLTVDVCTICALKDASSALRRVDDRDVRRLRRSDTPHLFRGIAAQVQEITVVNESGLYDLVFQSTKPEAREFKRWVTSDLLPRYRRGELVAVEAASAPAIPDMSTAEGQLAVLDMWRSQVEARMASDQRALEAEQRVEELEPKAAAADALMETEGAVSMGVVANAFKLGRQELFDMLREEKIIQKDRRPYQDYADWFRVTIRHYDDSNGTPRPYVNTRMYPAGALRLHALLTKRGRELRKPVFDNQLSLLSGGAA